MNVFVSCHSEDTPVQIEVMHALRRLDGVRAYTIDLAGLLGPKDVFASDKLYEKLNYPDLAVVLLSRHYFDEPWFYHELPALMAIESRLNVDIILPVLLDGLDDNRVPQYLLRKDLVDFRGKPAPEGLQELTARVKGTHKRESSKVFIVHGHDVMIKEAVARFVERLELEAVILHERANSGLAIIEKLERHTDVGFALVLLTPDDVGAARDNVSNLQPRARQNVIFELGMFVGRLGRRRVCILHKGSVELPSDYQGVTYIPLDEGGAWRMGVVKELREAGFPVDKDKAL